MLKHEVAQMMHMEQYGTFIKTVTPVAHALPDGRMLVWYNERDVHEFLTAWESTHPSVDVMDAEPSPTQLELPLNDTKSEAVPVHACFGPLNHEDKCDGTGSKDSGVKP
jgi:hypothetical protein